MPHTTLEMAIWFTLHGSADGCTYVAAPTDHPSDAPKLGSLANHGGPTETLPLQSGSPALDRVPTAPCHALVTRDQRGVPRPQGKKCDIGAFERKL